MLRSSAARCNRLRCCTKFIVSSIFRFLHRMQRADAGYFWTIREAGKVKAEADFDVFLR